MICNRSGVDFECTSRDCIVWEQRGGLSTPVGCITGISKIIQDVAMLLFQSSDDRHNAFDKATTVLALRTETAFAPKDSGTDLTFGQVIGWFYPFDMHEGPQRCFSFEDITASAGSLAVVAGRTLTKQLADIGLNGFHFILESASAHGSIADLVPPFKHQVSLGQDSLTHTLGFAASLNEGLEVTLEVRPT